MQARRTQTSTFTMAGTRSIALTEEANGAEIRRPSEKIGSG